MPFPRRRGGRRPFINSRWQIRRLEALCLFLSPTVRSTLTAWMKIYGETNDVPGLVSGPIEVRFRRLREHTGADVFLLWTTPERWAAGEALSLWIPAIGLSLECRFDDGRLVCDKARPTTEEERDPRRQRSAIGMELRPDSIELPTDATGENPSAGLVAAFERLLDRRWTSFVDPLREALEAEARDDTARAERLATPYAVATPRIGSPSESDPYRLSGVEASAVGAFDEGEWLDLVDTRGRVISSARLVRIDPAEGVMDVDVRGADPPSEGIVRPRPQTQILAQKRAILEELDNPTGGLANAVKLVASPASLTPPQRRRPAAFVNRLVAQNRSQVRAVSLALGLEEGQALMVQGPPGTGKSTTLAEILGQLVTRDKNVTVLVCSHSNHGVDNLLLKTLPYLESVPELAIARVGLFDRVNPLARPHFVPPGEDLGAFNVVFTTVDALALQVEAGGRTYDYAVLDEANRASILDSLIPLVRGRRFILVGDHLQLQPVLSEAEEALRLEPAVGNNSAIGKSLFAWLRERRFPEAATIFLDEQNRMHPIIAGLISEVFYEGKLRSGRRAPRRVADVPLFPSAVTWVDTRGLHGLREARGRGASLVNVPEARLVATIARHILGSSTREVDIGVISAYAEQTALLRRLLLHRNNQRQNGASGGPNARNNGLDRAAMKHLEIDTVDAFEGREKDIILVSLVRSNRRRDIGFLRLMQRINVALSRARTMLIIVGDTATLRGSYFDRIVRYIRPNGMLVPGPRLIGRLLNARSGGPIERPGERLGVPGRRRRPPLPSVRTAFPEQDPTAAAGPSAGQAGAEDADGQRGRRRRRRVRGRPGSERPDVVDRRGVPPTTTMEMTASAEPGPDEPATQYEIDRFAALVEQLLGDGASDDTPSEGGEAAAAPEVDRAHAEEVLADALRAVGQQTDREGTSRSRRGNNRRRSRRGQGRPLPGDAAVADAARRMAREEQLAGALSGEGYPALPGDQPGETPIDVAARVAGPLETVPSRVFVPADEPIEGGFRPASEPPSRPFVPADEPPPRPFVPADEPPQQQALPADEAPERPARPAAVSRRRRPAVPPSLVTAETGAAEHAASTPPPTTPQVAPVLTTPETPSAIPAESPERPRRTRRRAAALSNSEAAASAPGSVATPAPTFSGDARPVSPAFRMPAVSVPAADEPPADFPEIGVSVPDAPAARPADRSASTAAPAPRRTRRRVVTAEPAVNESPVTPLAEPPAPEAATVQPAPPAEPPTPETIVVQPALLAETPAPAATVVQPAPPVAEPPAPEAATVQPAPPAEPPTPETIVVQPALLAETPAPAATVVQPAPPVAEPLAPEAAIVQPTLLDSPPEAPRRSRRRVAAAAPAAEAAVSAPATFAPATFAPATSAPADVAPADVGSAPAVAPTLAVAPTPSPVTTSTEPAAPIRPVRRTRRSPAPPPELDAVSAPSLSAAPAPVAPPPPPADPVASQPELPAPAPEAPRRTRRRTPVTSPEPITQAQQPAVQSEAIAAPTPERPPSPVSSPSDSAPAAEPVVVEPAAVRPRATRRRTTPAPAAVEPSADVSASPGATGPVGASLAAPAPGDGAPTPAVTDIAPAPASPRARRRTPSPSADVTPIEPPVSPEPTVPAPAPRRSRAKSTSVPVETPAENGAAMMSEQAPEPKPRRTRRKATAAVEPIAAPSAPSEAPPPARPRRTRRTTVAAAPAEAPTDD